jgi:beta-glucosidase
VLDANVERVLNLIMKTPRFKGYKYSNKPDLKGNAIVSREAATEGMVLLKNTNHTLPMTKNGGVAVFGNTSYDIIAGGTGSGDVNKAYTISLVQGLTNSGYKVDDSLKSAYGNYMAMQARMHPRPANIMRRRDPIPEMTLDSLMIQRKAARDEVAVITIGRISGEGSDRKLDDDFYLSPAEKAMVKKISDAFHAKGKKVVIILNIGGVIETDSWRDYADAILLAWQPGQEAGNAIADVVSGKANPSGKLATTFPVDYKDVPSAKSFPGIPANKPDKVIYDDGIYVGYRYYDTYKVAPAYEFGYGLSYTNFSVTGLKLSALNFNGHVTATVKVTNIGKVAGKQVVQLYIGAPTQNIDKPEKELKGFAKTKLLQPGTSETLTFTINPSDLASYYTDKASWIADAGKYTVSVGTSSRQIKQVANFNLAKPIVTEKVENELTPQEAITEMKGK